MLRYSGRVASLIGGHVMGQPPCGTRCDTVAKVAGPSPVLVVERLFG
jgi:hypothetical protein